MQVKKNIEDAKICWGGNIRTKSELLKFKIISVEDALSQIKEGKTQSKIKVIREAYLKQGKESADKLKANLPYHIFQGEFSARNSKSLIQSSGLAIIDLDEVKEVEFSKRMLFDSMEFIYSIWVSPKGNGLKVLVSIPHVSTESEYKCIYEGLLEAFKDYNPDTKNKDLARACFVSYDQMMLKREWEDVEEFEIRVSIPTEKKDLFHSLAKGVLKVTPYEIGSRQKFLYQLSMDCIRYGIEKDVVINLFSERFTGFKDNLPKDEAIREIERVYEANSELWNTKQWAYKSTDTFIFYRGWASLLNHIEDDSEYRIAVNGILNFALDGVVAEMKEGTLAKSIFENCMKPIEKSKERYLKKINKSNDEEEK